MHKITQRVIGAFIFFPLMIVIALALGIKHGRRLKRAAFGPSDEWRSWFAWRPVRVDGQKVWLAKVERRAHFFACDAGFDTLLVTYRAPSTAHQDSDQADVQDFSGQRMGAPVRAPEEKQLLAAE